MFFKKKKIQTEQNSKIILGMVMLRDNNSFEVSNFTSDFNSYFNDNIKESAGDSSSFVFTVDGETIAIGHIPVPIPIADIEETARYAYNWQTVLEDTKEHKSHLIVSVIQGGQDQIKRFKIFTQVLSSLLRTTNSLGVYKGNQSLLIHRGDYLNEAGSMSDEHLPLNLWIYFGFRITDNGNSGYTYGLKEFNKAEMEVVNSSMSLEEIRTFLFNIAQYVIVNDVIFKDGQTCGLSEDEKVGITFSKGRFVEGDSFKLAY